MSEFSDERMLDLGEPDVGRSGRLDAQQGSSAPGARGAHGAGWARAVVLAVTLCLLFVLLALITSPSDRGLGLWVRGVGELAAALVAGVSVWSGAVRCWSGGDMRAAVALGLVATASWSWAWGQVIWLGYRLLLREVPPFPSMADAGFLAMPVLVTAALVVWAATTASRRAVAAAVLDGLIVAPALLLLLASTLWAQAVRRVVTDDAVLSAGFAYPLADIMVLSVLLQLLPRGIRSGQVALVLISAALTVIAATDIVWAGAAVVNDQADREALTATTGWFTGFALLATVGAAPLQRDHREAGPGLSAGRWFVLTYFPASAAISITIYHVAAGHIVQPLELASLMVIIAAAAGRQLLFVISQPRSTDA